MLDPLPWLIQGDVFRELPIIRTTLTPTGEIESKVMHGPAALLTHECAMDKPAGRSGNPRIEQLQFGQVRAMRSIDASRQALLRKRGLAPYEAFYLGDLGSELGDSFVLFSDSYYLPAAYFQLSFGDFSGHESADQHDGGRYVIDGTKRDRVARLEIGEIDLLRRKLSAFWSRLA